MSQKINAHREMIIINKGIARKYTRNLVLTAGTIIYASLLGSDGFNYRVINKSDIPVTGTLLYSSGGLTICPKMSNDFTLEPGASMCFDSFQTLTTATCCLGRINYNNLFNKLSGGAGCKDLSVIFENDTTSTPSVRYQPLEGKCETHSS